MNRKAFTLIEILIVTALVAAVSVAIANAFSNGLKLWARADRLTQQTQAGIFIDKFSEDLRQTHPISTLRFKGRSTEIQFPTQVLTPADPHSARHKEEMVNTIGAVRYRFDHATKSIYRSQANYGQALKGKFTDEQIVVEGIEEVSFTYYHITEKGYEGKSVIDEGVPAAVLIKITMIDEGNHSQFERFCPIALGGAL